MPFTYQINDGTAFITDETLLQKAEQYKPELYYRENAPVGIVELTEDHTSLGGTSVKSSALTLTDLSAVRFGRGTAIFLISADIL